MQSGLLTEKKYMTTGQVTQTIVRSLLALPSVKPGAAQPDPNSLINPNFGLLSVCRRASR
jgi:hypothetical protein